LKRKYFWGSGFWSPVVYFDSVGRNEDQMRNYVRKQGNTTSL
jgi:REP element-mobilizing transposase RayT